MLTAVKKGFADRLCLFLFVIVIAGSGPFLDFNAGPMNFSGIRLFLVLIAAYQLLTGRIDWGKTRFSRLFLGLLLFWIVYGAVTLLWAPSKTAGVKEIGNIIFGILLYLVIRSLWSRLADFPRLFVFFWNAVFLAVLLFALSEVIAGIHIPGSFATEIHQYGGYHQVNHVPVTFFDNPNHFGMYLVVTVVLNCVALYRSDDGWIPLAVIAFAILMILFTESRLSFYAAWLIVALSASWYVNLRVSSLVKRFVSFLVIALFFFAGLWMIRQIGSFPSLFYTPNPAALVSVFDDATDMSDFRVVPVALTDVNAFKNGETLELSFRKLGSAAKPEHSAIAILSVGLVALAFVTGFLFFRKRYSAQRFFGISTIVAALFFVTIYLRLGSSAVESDWKNYVLTTELHHSMPKTEFMEVSDRTLHRLKKGDSIRFHATVKDRRHETISGDLRRGLAVSGVGFFVDSEFLGAGAGSFQVLMAAGKGKAPAGGLTEPHSMAIEILSQYGLPVALPLLLLMGFILLKMGLLWRIKWRNPAFLTLVLCLPAFVLLSNANSTSLVLPLIWLMISLIILNFEQLIAEKPEVWQ